MSKLMISGKMGSGKGVASAHLQQAHGALCWSRTERMKALAHAVADQVGDLEGILAAVLPGVDERDRARQALLTYIAGYQPEPGKPRQLYQDITQLVMDIDPLAFERELHQRITDSVKVSRALVLIDDVRSLDAFRFFADHGFISIRIDASEPVRRERMRMRDGYIPPQAAFEHPSETELDGVEHDHVIINNGADPRVLHDQIDRIISLVT